MSKLLKILWPLKYKKLWYLSNVVGLSQSRIDIFSHITLQFAKLILGMMWLEKNLIKLCSFDLLLFVWVRPPLATASQPLLGKVSIDPIKLQFQPNSDFSETISANCQQSIEIFPFKNSTILSIFNSIEHHT